MTTTEITVGTKVMCNGHEGTVTRVCEWDTDLVEVRLESGTICTGKSDFDGRYANCYVIE